jgi:hypothetical protein
MAAPTSKAAWYPLYSIGLTILGAEDLAGDEPSRVVVSGRHERHAS